MQRAGNLVFNFKHYLIETDADKDFFEAMSKLNILSTIMAVIPFFIFGQDLEFHEEKFKDFDNGQNWILQLGDAGTDDWNKDWFLDGEKATIDNSEEGMHFQAGPQKGNDAHHAVLWTKKSFEGDIKIEYEYTKTDTLDRYVNILYIQATGIDKEAFSKDIFEWKDLRRVPKMSSYFKNMNTFHISYAAISAKEGYHYVRARRYPETAERSFKETMIAPTYDKEQGTFKNGITYQITAIKTNDDIFFKVVGGEKTKIFSWPIAMEKTIEEGRVGLRHMYARSARYKNIKIYTNVDSKGQE